MLIDLCQSTCSCSYQCSTIIMKRIQATLFGFLVLNVCWLFSVWVIDLHLIIHFVYKNGLFKWINKQRFCNMDTAHPRVASHPIHAPPPPPPPPHPDHEPLVVWCDKHTSPGVQWTTVKAHQLLHFCECRCVKCSSHLCVLTSKSVESLNGIIVT